MAKAGRSSSRLLESTRSFEDLFFDLFVLEQVHWRRFVERCSSQVVVRRERAQFLGGLPQDAESQFFSRFWALFAESRVVDESNKIRE